MGGTEDEPQVYVYDAQYALIMLDLMDGDEGWMLMVQHDADYLSMYYGLLKPFKQVGASVQAGETLGLVAQETMRFELWQRGLVLNPEEVISF